MHSQHGETEKTRYKMYKDGKKWVFAGITTFAISLGLSAIDVSADVTTTDTSDQTTTQAQTTEQSQTMVLASESTATDNTSDGTDSTATNSIGDQLDTTAADSTATASDDRVPVVNIDPVQTTDTTITGTGTAGDKVVVKDATGKVISETTVDASGKWTVENTSALKAGDQVTAEVTNPNNGQTGTDTILVGAASSSTTDEATTSDSNTATDNSTADKTADGTTISTTGDVVDSSVQTTADSTSDSTATTDSTAATDTNTDSASQPTEETTTDTTTSDTTADTTTTAETTKTSASQTQFATTTDPADYKDGFSIYTDDERYEGSITFRPAEGEYLFFGDKADNGSYLTASVDKDGVVRVYELDSNQQVVNTYTYSTTDKTDNSLMYAGYEYVYVQGQVMFRKMANSSAPTRTFYEALFSNGTNGVGAIRIAVPEVLTQTIHYVDRNTGNVLIPDVTQTGNAGQSYTTGRPESITVDGVTYYLVIHSEPANASGTLSPFHKGYTKTIDYLNGYKTIQTQISTDGLMQYTFVHDGVQEGQQIVAPGEEYIFTYKSGARYLVRNSFDVNQLESYEVTYEYDARLPKTDITTPLKDDSLVVTGVADKTVSQPGDTVNVYDTAGKLMGTTTVAEDYTWSINIPREATMTPAGYVTAEILNPATGMGTTDSEQVVDTRVPNVTVDSVKDTDTTLTGKAGSTGKPGDKVVVTDAAGAVIGETTIQSDGTWTITNIPAGSLQPNTEITATITNPLNNATGVTNTTVADTRKPEVNLDPVDEASKAITGNVTGTTGKPGDLVTVTDDDGQVIGTTTVDENGNWTVPVPDGQNLVYGDTVHATIENPNNHLTGIAEKTITDTHQPDVTINAVKDTDAVITGTAGMTGEPGDRVVVKDATGTVIGETTIKDDGTWSIPVPKDIILVPGTKVTATATNPNDLTQTPKEAITDVVDTRIPDVTINPAKDSDTTLTGTAGDNGKPGDNVVVTDATGAVIGETTIQDDGTWSITDIPAGTLKSNTEITATITNPLNNETGIAKTPVADTRVPGVNIDPVHTTDDKITGTGTPGDKIVVKDPDGKIIGETTVDDNGDWSVPNSDDLKDGDKVTADVTNPNNGQTSSAQTSVIDTTTPTVDINNVHTNDHQIAGNGTVGGVVTVTDEAGHKLGSAIVDENGQWMLNVPADYALHEGSKLTATITNMHNGKTATAETIVIAGPAAQPAPQQDEPTATPAQPEAKATQTLNPTKPVAKDVIAKAEQALPNTGEQETNTLTGLGVAGLLLGMLGLGKKKRKED